MNKKHKFLICKILSVSKFSLGIVLALIAIRTVLILRQSGGIQIPCSAVAAPNLTVEQPVVKNHTTVSDYAAIFEKNIFGSIIAKSGLEENTSEAIPSAEELLGLSLTGTIAGNKNVARAIIKDIKTNMSGLYKIGDSIGGATIERIEKNSVILIHDRQKKSLNLYARGNSLNNTAGLRSGQTTPVQQTAIIETTSAGRAEEKTLSRLDNIGTALKTAIIEPNSVGGKVEGLEIKDIGSSQQFAASIGLKNGDIVQAVNDQKLTSTQKAFQVLKKARSESTLTVKLTRDEKPETLSFQLR
jgi:type II secretion system protein C